MALAVKASGATAFGTVADFAVAGQRADRNYIDAAMNESGAALVTWLTSAPPGPNFGDPTPVDVVRVAARPAGGTFTQLSPAYQTAFAAERVVNPHVHMDAAGRGTLVWAYDADSPPIFGFGLLFNIKSAARPPSGSFGSVENVSGADLAFTSLEVDGDSEGTALARLVFGLDPEQHAPGRRQLGNTIQDVSGPGNFFLAPDPAVRFDPSGRAIVVWAFSGGSTVSVQSATRPKGGTFGAVTEIVSVDPSGPGRPFRAPRPSVSTIRATPSPCGFGSSTAAPIPGSSSEPGSMSQPMTRPGQSFAR